MGKQSIERERNTSFLFKMFKKNITVCLESRCYSDLDVCVSKRTGWLTQLLKVVPTGCSEVEVGRHII